MALIDTLLRPIEALWDRLFGGTVIAKIVTKVTDGVGHVSTLVSRVEHLIDSIRNEITEFSHWKEDIKFKSRVINVPAAAAKIGDLVQGLRDSWQAIIALAEDFKRSVQGEDPKREAAELAEDLGDVDNVGVSLLKRFPALARSLEKLLGVITLFVDAVIQWSDAVDRLQTIVDEITRLRELVESGEQLFLPQNNRRSRLALRDGGSIQIRVGSLHDS